MIWERDETVGTRYSISIIVSLLILISSISFVTKFEEEDLHIMVSAEEDLPENTTMSQFDMYFKERQTHNGRFPIDTSRINGALKWKFKTGMGIFYTPAIAEDGTIYVCSDHLYAINPDGTEKWRFTEDWPFTSPAVGRDGVIYFGAVAYNFHAIHPNGTEKWRFNSTDPGYYTEPVVRDNGDILIGNHAGKLFCFYPKFDS